MQRRPPSQELEGPLRTMTAMIKAVIAMNNESRKVINDVDDAGPTGRERRATMTSSHRPSCEALRTTIKLARRSDSPDDKIMSGCCSLPCGRESCTERRPAAAFSSAPFTLSSSCKPISMVRKAFRPFAALRTMGFEHA